MADTAPTDLVMMFVKDGSPVPAECQLSIDPDDTLMQDFEPDGFFELTGFNFSLTSQGSDKAAEVPAAAGQTGQTSASKGADLSTFYKLGVGDDNKSPVRMRLVEGSFDRNLDSASPIFFEACCKKIGQDDLSGGSSQSNANAFEKAVVVKRVSQGGDLASGSGVGFSASASVGFSGGGLSASASASAGAGGGATAGTPNGIVRIEFSDVLIVEINWDDGEIVKESCHFSAKRVLVTYLTQSDDGTIQPDSAVQAEWPDPDDPQSDTST